MNETVKIGPASIGEAAAISHILALNREDPGLFQESATAVARAFKDFFVARNETGEVLGCAGLHRDSLELAEVYAVAVAPACQGQGIGSRLLQTCQQRAAVGGIRHLWLATVKPAYFARHNFQPISRWQLPVSVLFRKLRQTFHQPITRWLPTLLGRHTFMRAEVNSPHNS